MREKKVGLISVQVWSKLKCKTRVDIDCGHSFCECVLAIDIIHYLGSCGNKQLAGDKC